MNEEQMRARLDLINRILQVIPRQAFPEDWAASQNNLAAAYSDRIKEERADNLKLAI